jgi:hypothetical protein
MQNFAIFFLSLRKKKKTNQDQVVSISLIKNPDLTKKKKIHDSQAQKRWSRSQKRRRIIDTIFVIYTYLYQSPQDMCWYHCIPIAYISIIYMIPYIPYLKVFWYHHAYAYGMKFLGDLKYILIYHTSITFLWY